MANINNTYWLKEGLSGEQSGTITTQQEQVVLEFDEIIDNVKDAIAESGFESGQLHRNDSTLRLQGNIQAEPHDDDNGASWVYSLTYSDNPMTPQTNSVEDDTYYIPEVAFGKWTYTLTVDKDKETGGAILNTAGDPYDPLPVEAISSPMFSITVKENSPNLGRILDIGSINSQDVQIAGIAIPKYCGMLEDYQPEPFREIEDVVSFMNTYTFKLKYFKNKDGDRIGFKLENASTGFNQIVEGEKVEIKVKSIVPDSDPVEFTEEPTATPLMLNEDGAVTDTPFYQEWVVHDLVNFASYGLPTSYPVS